MIDERTQSTRAFYQRHAAEYAAATLRAPMDRFIERFAQELPRGARVADLGCGGGRDLRLLRERGLDPIGLGSAEALAVIAQQYSGACVVVGDLSPFHVFDGVSASASIASQTGRYERTSRRDISCYASRRSLFWIGKIRKGRGSPPAPLAVRVEAIPTVELKSSAKQPQLERLHAFAWSSHWSHSRSRSRLDERKDEQGAYFWSSGSANILLKQAKSAKLLR